MSLRPMLSILAALACSLSSCSRERSDSLDNLPAAEDWNATASGAENNAENNAENMAHGATTAHGQPATPRGGANMGGTDPHAGMNIGGGSTDPHAGMNIGGGSTDPHAGMNIGGGSTDPHAGMNIGGGSTDPHAGMNIGGGSTDPHAGVDMGGGHPGAQASSVANSNLQPPDPNRPIDESKFLRGTIVTTDVTAALVKPGAILFLSAKPIEPVTGEVIGNPIAVDRIDISSMPATFHLSDRSAMAAGTTFVGDVLITARVDADGEASSKSPGDVEGTLRAKIPADKLVLKLDTVLR